MREDLARAWRQAARQPLFTAVVVAVLGLGLGVNAALFSVADAVLFRPLPVAQPSRLVLFQWTSGPSPAVEYLTGEWWQEPVTGRVTASSFSYPAFQAFREPGKTLEAVFAAAEVRRVSVDLEGRADLATAQLVSGSYHAGLGVPVRLGRALATADDRAGAELAAVISHGYWQRRFGGARDVIGRRGTLDGRPLTVVGVSAPGFAGTLPLGESADLSVALLAWRAAGERYLTSPAWHWLQVMGRLRPDASAAQAEAEMAARLSRVAGGLAGDAPRLHLADGSLGPTRDRVEQRRPLAVLGIVTGVVLLMACSSVAGLLLARGAARRREIGVRLALGAGRARVVRQLLLEGVVLAVLGGGAAVALAGWTKDALAAGLVTGSAPAAALDARTLGFVCAAVLLTVIASAVAPALRAAGVDLVHDLRRTDTALRLGAGRALVVVQVALAIVLLVSAGLFVRTLRNLGALDLGFMGEGVHLFKVHAASGAASRESSRRLLARFQALPGVRAAGVSAHQLLGDGTDRTRVSVAGRPRPAAGDEFARVNRVGGDFFGAQGIPIRAGRALGPQDDAGSPPTVVVNEAFARAYLAGAPPLGRHVNGAEVVGVAADTRFGALREPTPPVMFVPVFQQGQGSFCFQLRADVPAGTLEPLVRQAVRAVEPAAAVYDFTTPEALVHRSLGQERLLAGLTSLFAALTLLLASLGLYGLMAYAMARRTREIGVRVALGAAPARVLRLALGGGLRLAAAGAALGIPAALAAARLARGVLFGVAPTDLRAIAAALLLVAALTLLACALPARRAARVDPAAALRYE